MLLYLEMTGGKNKTASLTNVIIKLIRLLWNDDSAVTFKVLLSVFFCLFVLLFTVLRVVRLVNLVLLPDKRLEKPSNQIQPKREVKL